PPGHRARPKSDRTRRSVASSQERVPDEILVDFPHGAREFPAFGQDIVSASEAGLDFVAKQPRPVLPGKSYGLGLCPQTATSSSPGLLLIDSNPARRRYSTNS